MPAAPNGSPAESPLDVERVEWFPATSEAIEVRVVGRWREKSPRSAPELVVDDGGDKRRFKAERGAGIDESGRWSARYSIPIELRPRLATKLALVHKDKEIPLPAASPGPADERNAPPPAQVVDPTVMAERRARRAEMVEESVVRRAQAAEQTVTTLETQLSNLEERLRTATGERDELARELRAAEQRAESESRVRTDAEEDREQIKGDTERQLAELRARLAAAEDHAARLAGEMDDVRREGAEAQQAAVAARKAAERAEAAAREREDAASRRLEEVDVALASHEGVAGDLARLSDEARALSERLATERAAREEAERTLAAERERFAEAGDKVTLLEHELDRRARVQSTVQVELEELREDLVRVKAQAEDQAKRQSGAVETLADLSASTKGLRARIQELDAAERNARAELERRTGELARTKGELERARAELATAEVSEGGRAAALREAERSIAAVRQESSDAQAKLEEERRKRFETEAALKSQLERERDRFTGQLAESEGQLRAQIAQQRSAFEEQVTSIESMVIDLRGRLTQAAAELEAKLEAERGERDDLDRVIDELEADRDRLRDEADRVKREAAADMESAADARAAREGAVEALVADVLKTASSLRESLQGELRAFEERVETEREGFRADLADVEQRVASLGADLEVERTARWVAEQELATERKRAAEPPESRVRIIREEASAADLERVRDELTSARTELDAERARADRAAAATEDAEQLRQDLEAAEARLKAESEPGVVDEEPEPEPDARVEPEPEAEAAPEPEPDPFAASEPDAFSLPRPESQTPRPRREAGAPEPGVWPEPALPMRPDPEPRPDARSTEPPTGRASIVDQVSPGDAPLEREAERPAPAESESEAPDGAAEHVVPSEAPELPDPLALSAARPEVTPSGAQLLAPRVVAAGGRRSVGWLSPAIEVLGETNEAAAAQLVVELLPAQGAALADRFAYAVTIDGHGTYRVELGAGRGMVEKRPGAEAVGDVEVRITGPASSLAGLVAGNAGRRLRGARVEGHKRRLRKLLKARRNPVALADFAQQGLLVDPGLILDVLALAIDPAWTTGHRFTIAYDVEGAGVFGLVSRDGDDVIVQRDPPLGEAAAVISVSHAAFLPLLARLAPPPGERAWVRGNVHAVELLTGWFDRAQGIAE